MSFIAQAIPIFRIKMHDLVMVGLFYVQLFNWLMDEFLS